MNFDNLITWVAGIVLAAALTGHIDDLQLWIWKAQAKVVHDSRTSTWGSPRFFGPTYSETSKPQAATHSTNQDFKTTTDRKIHSESRSN